MQKYQLTLLSVLTALFIFNGCDSSCCQDVKDKIAPTPVITQNGQKINGTITCDNAEVQTITLAAASQDSDGEVTQNIWTEDGNPINDGIVQCPPAGQTKEVCLTAVDNDNLENQTCITIKGIDTTPPAPQLKPPVSIIEKGEDTGDGIYMDCSKVHDQDTIDSDGVTNPYGTDKAIKEVTWTYTYYTDDNTVSEGPNVKTQTAYNDAEDLPEETCKKWFHTTNIFKIVFSIETLDDDNQTTTSQYTYHVGDGTLIKQ